MIYILKNRYKIGLLFLSPFFLFYFTYFLLPILYNCYLSFFFWDGISPDIKFAGLDNWKQIFFHDKVINQCLINNLILLFTSLFIQLPLAFIMSAFLNEIKKFTRFFKVLLFLPFILSDIIISILWKNIFHTNYGLLPNIINLFTKQDLFINLLANPFFALLSIVFTITWYHTPFYMILFSAGILSIPRTTYDAAVIDGVKRWQKYLYIVFPILWKDVFRVAVLICIVNSIKHFTVPFIITEGGPGHATDLLSMYVYRKAFTFNQISYACAIGVFMLYISFILFFAFRFILGFKKK